MNYSVLHALNQAVITASEGGASQYIGQVVTTIVVFLVVLWILRRYAFDPILAIIDERRGKIASDLKNAEDLQKKAGQERAELESRLRNIETEARERMQELVNEGKKIAKSIQDKAHQEAEAVMEKARKTIQTEVEQARVEMKQQIVALTLQATERLIQERLDDDKHLQLINNFLNEVERN